MILRVNEKLQREDSEGGTVRTQVSPFPSNVGTDHYALTKTALE